MVRSLRQRKCANALRRSDQQLRPMLADLVDGVLHLALNLEVVSKAAMDSNWLDDVLEDFQI